MLFHVPWSAKLGIAWYDALGFFRDVDAYESVGDRIFKEIHVFLDLEMDKGDAIVFMSGWLRDANLPGNGDRLTASRI